MRIKKITGWLLFLTLALASCQEKTTDEPLVDNRPPIQVQLQTIASESGPAFFTVSGKVEAAKTVNVSTRMMGYVEQVNAKVGDRVRKGQQLVRINATDLSAKRALVDANIQQAEVALANAEKDFQRFHNLFEEKSATQKELDDVTMQYNLAKTRVEAAKQMKNEVNAQFSYANIKAPISGVITNKLVNAGDIASPGMALLEIETAGQLQVVARVSESDIAKVKLNTEVEVLIKSLGETLKGKVSEVATSAKYTGGQYLVKIDLPALKGKVLSGMYSTVKFPAAEAGPAQTTYVPTAALVTQGQLSGVYTVSESNTALLRWLRLGRQLGTQVEVLAGLAPGETIIVGAEGKLYNGAKISK